MRQGVVAAGHPQTAQAAAEVLESGGNAFDAAIAALYVSSIAEPALASLGGGGFLLAAPHDERPTILDFFVQTPAQHKSADELDARSFICDFGSAQQEFIIGAGTSAVPGYVAGLFETARRYATMPMTELIQPAVALLKQGIEVTAMQAHIFSILTPIYLHGKAAQIFQSRRSPGTTAQAQEVIFMPGYADLLESLAIEGEDLFYRGEIAQAVEQIALSGGLIRYADMANYAAEIRAPLDIDYGDHRIFLNPPPSSGGTLIGFDLSRLKRCGIGQHTPGSDRYIEMMLDTLAASSRLGTADFEAENETDAAWSDYCRSELRDCPLATRGTTHISIIDRRRNAVSVSVSNGEGCGTLIPNTAVMLNNMLGEHDLNPWGVTGWPTQVRLSSMMAPTVAINGSGRLIALGSGGSNRIPSAIAQVLIGMVEFGLSAKEAVRAPRVHYHQGHAYLESAEPSAMPASLADAYPEHTRFDRRDVYFGGVHAVSHAGRLAEGFGDDRRGGVAVTVG